MFYRNTFEELKKWSKSPTRRPLILRGARQVGKTTIVDVFGGTFDHYIKLNLETPDDKNLFTTSTDIDKLVQAIFFTRQKELANIADTLLFIDEIQQVDGALNMLRYFYEKYPDLRVIAAGSLLETVLNRKTNVPVGRVEYRVMRPVSFPEFLKALGYNLALEQLEHLPLNDFAHHTLLGFFHTYALIGGMPEIIANYADKKDLTALPAIYDRLINAYLDDVEKYGKTDTHVRVIRHCIRVCFAEAGKRIKFQHFGRSDYSSREVAEALRTLEKVFLLSLLYPTISPVLPLLPDLRKSPRLQVLDTGMMNYFLGIQTDILGTDDLNKVYQGTIIEHLVGQELLALDFSPLSGLNFWVREKKTSLAEIDYVYPFEGQLIPIEVKAGKTGSLKSLHLFMDEAPHDLSIRFWSEPLNLSTITTPSGKSFRLLSLPYYLASQTEKYIAWLKAQPPPTSPV